LLLVRNLRARRYVLRLKPDGTARVTVPRAGNIAFALDFARRHIPWLERQLQKPKPTALTPAAWTHGTEILLRGVLTPLEVVDGHVRAGHWTFSRRSEETDLRPRLEYQLRRVITPELVARTLELAALHGLQVRRVTVRDQRSRWGSCSPRGTVSLNWRLIQTPIFVRDYIILHELMHLREMNHSPRYWRHVEHVCPDYVQAEQWLKQHAILLR
jgi:predicted metal-dependent hydrolase